MKTYKKNYIGKGTQNANLGNVVKMTLKVKDVLKFKYEFDGVEYISFEMGALKEPDQYGRTHTAWVSERVKDAEPVAEAKPAPKKRKTNKPVAEEKIPC
jgi:hypothetical protein